MKRYRFFLPVFVALSLLACASQTQPAPPPAGDPVHGSQPTPPRKVELMVSAAASLQDAMNEMKASFEAEHPQVTVTFIFGSSGKLVRQISEGAPSDVFLSASAMDMDTLQEKRLIVEDTRVDFARNELVLIAPKGSAPEISSFEQIDHGTIDHFAIGDPKSVPAGRYAEETLKHLNLWDRLRDKFVLGSDVRQVLAYVETGNADLGVVYATDALLSDNVRILAFAEPEWHSPIVYPAAVIANSKQTELAKAFVDYLAGDKGKEILKKYGFQYGPER